MAGDGVVERTTSFSLKTGSRPGGGIQLPTFTGYRILANGHPELSLTGAAGRSYTVRRKDSLANPNWITAGTVTLNASGNTVFEDADGTLKFPAFYQAVSQGPSR